MDFRDELKMVDLRVEILSEEEQKKVKDFWEFYKFVSKCIKCGNLFGHDKENEKFCYFCDPKTIDKFKVKRK
jgi:hypothetical protein